MLRTLTLALMIGFPGLAGAEQFPQSALDVDVRGDDGRVVGRVSAVQRNGDGEIVAVEIPGLEPADAPRAPRDMIAEERRERMVRINGEDAPRETPSGVNARRTLR